MDGQIVIKTNSLRTPKSSSSRVPSKQKTPMQQSQNIDHTCLEELKTIANCAEDSQKTEKYYIVELINVPSMITAVNKFMSLHPEFFKTNVNRRIINRRENQVYSIYTDPVIFRDAIHKVTGFIETFLDPQNDVPSMKIHIKRNNKNKECYVRQIESYVNKQTKFGNNVELNYYKILNDTIIKHCYYSEAVEQWAKDVSLVKSEFFSQHKEYLFSIIENKMKSSGVGNTANSWNNLILYGAGGTGKCLAKGTTIRRADGGIVTVEDVRINDKLMGDDFNPRTVLELYSGYDMLYEVKHIDTDVSYVVTGNHVITLYDSDKLIDMPLVDLIMTGKKDFRGCRYDGKILITEDIEISIVGIGKYYGFLLDGNHRFILGNGVITHNSSFIYRASMMLKLSILSVDLSLYLNKKKDLYALFHGQEFSLPESKTNEPKQPAIMNSIIVLEEFDHAINRLLDIESIFEYKRVIKREYLNMKNKEFKDKTSELLQEHKQPKETHEDKDFATRLTELKEKMKTEDISFDKLMEIQMMEDGIDKSSMKVFNDARESVMMKRDFDNQICGINAELDGIIKSMDEDNRSNILRLSDMLELFQGPVPVKNRIIIATTNNFSLIQKSMPTLFRSGRMTPIHFDYLDWKSLNDLCMYYFQREMSCEPRKISIPTSQIIELAIKYVLTHKPFEEFQKELLTLIF